MTTGYLLAVLYFASGAGTVEMHELPPLCHTDGSCVTDDAILIQIARGSDQEKRHTAQLVSKLEDLANKVIDGTEKITNATKAALETIDDEMDSIISHAEQNQKDFQASVDRAKQAIEACGTTTNTVHSQAGGISDLAAAVSTARIAHNTCRTSESNLKQGENKKCTKFNGYVADLKMPSCSCSTADSLGVVGFKNCVAEMATWSSTAKTTWAEEEKLCDDATSAHDAERTSCNTKQGSLESDFCSYNTAISMACSTQDSCRAKEIALREEEHASVAVSESAFKAEYASAKHVKCILKVLNATDEVKRGMLTACTSEKVGTEHLSIKYQEVPDPASCDLTPVANKPCDQEWTDEEFQGKTWLTDAPLNNCVPCPAVGGATTTIPTTAPTAAPTVSSAADAFGAGESDVCAALTQEGLKVWPNKGNVGLNAVADANPIRPTLFDAIKPGLLPSVENIAKVYVGRRNFLVLTVDSQIWCVGYDCYHDGTNNHVVVPTQVFKEVSDKIVRLATGFENLCALTELGQVYCAGRGDMGQIGNAAVWQKSGNKQTNTPTLVDGLPSDDKVVDIQMFNGYGGWKAYAVTQSKKMYSWGQQHENSLGRPEPNKDVTSIAGLVTVIPAGETVETVTVGGYGHVLVLATSGKMFCWGYNNYGQCGCDNTIAVQPVCEVTLPGGVVPKQIAMGYGTTYVVTTAGKVLAWGYNAQGQLGDGTATGETPRTAKEYVKGLPPNDPVVAVRPGNYFVLARLASGLLYCWGGGDKGVCGDGTKEKHFLPVKVEGIQF